MVGIYIYIYIYIYIGNVSYTISVLWLSLCDMLCRCVMWVMLMTPHWSPMCHIPLLGLPLLLLSTVILRILMIGVIGGSWRSITSITNALVISHSRTKYAWISGFMPGLWFADPVKVVQELKLLGIISDSTAHIWGTDQINFGLYIW